MMDSYTIFVARTNFTLKKKGKCVVVFVGPLALDHVLALLNRFE
jgi:hypothetical protein